MIVHLRGTNGAGKSTIVRSIMQDYDECKQKTRPGRRRPIGYVCTRMNPSATLFIPGHYEIANGGIDTLGTIKEALDLVWEAYDAGYNVLFEGKNMQDATVSLRATELFGKEQIAFVHVTHDVDECVAAVRQRGHSIAEKTIRSIDKRAYRVSEGLIANGYRCYSLSRDKALDITRRLLRGELP